MTKIKLRLGPAWAEFARFLRFGLAGVVNTLIGLGIIAALDLGMHVRPAIANAAGYAAGIALSFVLTHHFVFRSQQSTRTVAPRFLLSAAIAFAANQAVLAAAGHLLGGDPASRLAAQVFGMSAYTLTLFVISRFWTFKE